MIAGIIGLARLLQFVGALLLFGAPLFYRYGLPPHSALRLWQRPLAVTSAAVALLGAAMWSVAETVAMDDGSGDAMHGSAVWLMLSQTRFGLACLIRMAILLLALGVLFTGRLKRPWSLLAVLGAVATLSFAWTGHGAQNVHGVGRIHLMADLLHLLAAGIWIGALAPLLLLAIRAKRSGQSEDAQALAYGLDRFSSIGVWTVVVLVASGIVNCWFLIGPSRWRALFSSAYGLLLCIKVAFFAAMLGLAMLNRYRFAPALTSALCRPVRAAASVDTFRASLVVESLLAALVLIAVSALGMLAPLSSTD
jgi:putative copper resistance protein D